MWIDRVAMTIEQVPDEELDGRIAELAEKRELLALLTEQERRRAQLKWLSYYPDSGPLRRELYKKHLSFFAAPDIRSGCLWLQTASAKPRASAHTRSRCT